MPTISAIKLGASALLAQRAAIETTGHNIANISTPGYSRQRAEQAALSPMSLGFGFLGRGAEVVAVTRIADRFLNSSLRDAAGESAEADTLAEAYRSLESFFNELTDYDLSTSISGLFDALQDLASNVENEAARTAVVEQALAFRDILRNLREDVADLRSRMDEQIVNLADEVNSLALQVAQLNTEIVSAEAGKPEGSAGDLRDKRDYILRQLSELIDVTAIEQTGGSVNVTVAGSALVMGGQSYELSVELESSGGQAIHTVRLAEGGSQLRSGSGKLQGLIGARDEVLVGYIDELDELAATFIWHFNRVHAGGVGEHALSSVQSSYAVSNPADPLSSASLSFDAPTGTFQIRNGSFVIYVRDETTGTVSARNVQVDLDGSGTDTALLNPATGNDLVSLINAAAPELTASVDSRGRLTISSNSANATFYFGNDTSGLLATLGLNSFFTGHNAASIDVNAAIVADDLLVAAGRSVAAGDNANVLDLAALRGSNIFDGGARTLDDFYQSVVGRVATESAKAATLSATRSAVLTRLENEREQVSGVSLDEEMTRLIEYQRSYQGAAKFISVVDELLETLLAL